MVGNQISARLANYPLECGSFEEAFLEYLEERWNAEPLLPHYVMAAIQVCAGARPGLPMAKYPWPDFVIGYLEWQSHRFLYDQGKGAPGVEVKGRFRQWQSNDNKLSHQWNRFEDCFHLFDDWYNGRPPDFTEQIRRYRIVEAVDRRGSVPELEFYPDLAEALGLNPEKWVQIKEIYMQLTRPPDSVGSPFPIALLHDESGYSIVTCARMEKGRSRPRKDRGKRKLATIPLAGH